MKVPFPPFPVRYVGVGLMAKHHPMTMDDKTFKNKLYVQKLMRMYDPSGTSLPMTTM